MTSINASGIQPARDLPSDHTTQAQTAEETADSQATAKKRSLAARMIESRAVRRACFALTVLTTVVTGSVYSFVQHNPGIDGATSIAAIYNAMLAALGGGNYSALVDGVIFSATILIILGAHEMGHYYACRYHGVSATPPLFMPAPPMPITPFGTFGAVIKMKEPIRSRRALFDIGIAGPLAGFLFALPASVLGLLIAKEAPAPAGGSLQLNDPLLFILITKLLGLPHWIEWNPVYWACWAALLVTALNLFPVGQLDGGHVVYSLFGPRALRLVSIAVLGALIAFSIISLLLKDPSFWFMWVLILYYLIKVGHPPTTDAEPLGRARIVIAIISVVIFLLCFLPFPFSYT